MNCPDCLDYLQNLLDGTDIPPPAALEAHLAGCTDCRSWFAAAQRLRQGLRCQAVESPPGHLTAMIVNAIMSQRRLRQLRRLLVGGAAVAAAVLIALLVGYRGGHQPAPMPGPQAFQASPRQNEKRPPTPEPFAAPSLGSSVDAARSAMAALTGDLSARTKRLLGSAGTPLEPNSIAALPAVEELEKPLRPAAQSLRDSGRGVSDSLAAVTVSARRAVSYFLRELPGLPGEKKTGL